MGQERVFVATDVSNLWKTCKEEFGPFARVDFEMLSTFVPRLCHSKDVEQRLVAYIVTDPAQRHRAFRKVLRSFGYEVKERFLRHDKISGKPTRSDWDIGITIDALDQLDTYDTFVLMSGDGDFSLLLEYLNKKSKRTVVIAFEKSLSNSFYSVADELHTFKEDILRPLNGVNL